MPTLQQKRLLFEGGGIQWRVADQFPGNIPASLPTPRTCLPGPGTLTIGTPAGVSIVNGEVNVVGNFSAYNTGFTVLTPAIARVGGRYFSLDYKPNAAQHRWFIGFGGSHQLNRQSSVSFNVNGAITIASDNATQWWRVGVILRPTAGSYWFQYAQNGQPQLIWIDDLTAAITNFAAMQFDTSLGLYDNLYSRDLPYPFNTDHGLAVVNEAAPVGQYTNFADQISEFTITAPGVLANSGGFRFRVQDANNYWRIYYNSSGQMRLDTISGGVATNRISAGGIITGGATLRARVIARGSTLAMYSLSGTTWSKLGATIVISHLDDRTTIEPDLQAGWSGVDLRSYGVFNPVYAEMVRGIAA